VLGVTVSNYLQGGNTQSRAYIAVSPQIHCNPSSLMTYIVSDGESTEFGHTENKLNDHLCVFLES